MGKVKFSPDGRFLVAAGANQMHLGSQCSCRDSVQQFRVQAVRLGCQELGPFQNSYVCGERIAEISFAAGVNR